jgi:acyl dehydratase
MTLDPAIKGFVYDPVSLDYQDRETMLYALAVGAGTREDQLSLVYEESLQALPTLLVALPFSIFDQLEDGLGVRTEDALHGEQRLTLHRPVPPAGHLVARGHVERLWDKGQHAIIDTEVEVEVDGTLIATATYASFVRGAGGFGGERGSGLAAPEVTGAPDATAVHQTLAQQALLYRLTGDRNPLHADPAFALRAGQQRPILHGLCTYGTATRMVMDLVADGDPARVREANARFTSVVYPGDLLAVELWRLARDRAYARVTVPERGVTVIDPLLVTLTG